MMEKIINEIFKNRKNKIVEILNIIINISLLIFTIIFCKERISIVVFIILWLFLNALYNTIIKIIKAKTMKLKGKIDFINIDNIYNKYIKNNEIKEIKKLISKDKRDIFYKYCNDRKKEKNKLEILEVIIYVLGFSFGILFYSDTISGSLLNTVIGLFFYYYPLNKIYNSYVNLTDTDVYCNDIILLLDELEFKGE